MYRLKEAVLLAVKIHTESWEMHKQAYKIDINEAADKAAESVGYDKSGTEPLRLLLQNSWDEVLRWARENETKKSKRIRKTK